MGEFQRDQTNTPADIGRAKFAEMHGSWSWEPLITGRTNEAGPDPNSPEKTKQAVFLEVDGTFLTKMLGRGMLLNSSPCFRKFSPRKRKNARESMLNYTKGCSHSSVPRVV
ncbi:unnamed protein product [Ectocarpus sp. 13 AM-2016]